MQVLRRAFTCCTCSRHHGNHVIAVRHAGTSSSFRNFLAAHNAEFNGVGSTLLQRSRQLQSSQAHGSKQSDERNAAASSTPREPVASKRKVDQSTADGTRSHRPRNMRELRQQHARDLQRASSERHGQEVIAELGRMKKLMRLVPDAEDPAADRKLHELRTTFSAVASRLSSRHVAAVPSTKVQVDLLRACSRAESQLGPVAVGHLIAATAAALSQRQAELSGEDCAQVVVSLCQAQSGLAEGQKQQLVVAFLESLVQDAVENDRKGPSSTATRTTARGATPKLSDVSYTTLRRLIRLSFEWVTQHGHESREAQMGKRLVVRSMQLHAPMSSRRNGDECKNPSSSSSSNMEGVDLTQSPLAVADIVVFCQAVVVHRLLSHEALHFLAAAAPVVATHLYDLTGRQLSEVLLAYATIGYRNADWFVALGQRAGDMGEELHEDDAARVLRAFAMTEMEHGVLQQSLESSMRLRKLGRRGRHYGA